MTTLVCVFYEKTCPCPGSTIIMHTNVPCCASCGAVYTAVMREMDVHSPGVPSTTGHQGIEDADAP